MRPPAFEPRWMYGWTHAADAGLRSFFRAVAHHTGLPAVVVAAVAIVLSLRIVKRTFRFAVEVAVAVGFLLAATRLGWLTW